MGLVDTRHRLRGKTAGKPEETTYCRRSCKTRQGKRSGYKIREACGVVCSSVVCVVVWCFVVCVVVWCGVVCGFSPVEIIDIEQLPRRCRSFCERKPLERKAGIDRYVYHVRLVKWVE